jgi:uncharacterized membrane protein
MLLTNNRQMKEDNQMEKSSTGLSENVAGLLCYVLGWVSGLVFVLIEQESKFVRFHAMQSIYVFGIITVASIVLGWIPFIGIAISWTISVVGLILWIVLMIKAYQGVKYKLPWSGDLAEKWVNRQSGE